MARKIGEAFVRVSPDTSGFEPEARRELDPPLARMAQRMRARISDTPLGSAFARAIGRGAAAAGPAAGRAGDSAGSRFGHGFFAAATRRLGRLLPTLIRVVAVGAVVAVLGSLVAHLVAVTSALVPMVGVLAAVPGVAFAAAAGLGSLLLATVGIGAAWKAAGQASAGGAAASQAAARQVAAAQRSVESAERSLAGAQRDARDAQRELTGARVEAAEQLEDLTRNLAGARLDEEAAVLAVARAQEQLEATRGDPAATAMDVAEADLAYRQSVQTLGEVRDRLVDLAAEQQDASRKGVEGSDLVQGALRRQADAAVAVADAERHLAVVQGELATAGAGVSAGASKAADAMGRLAPAARQLVTVGRELAEVWRTRVQQAVQQATFAGVAGDLRLVSGALLPTMERRLTGMGRAWNLAIRETLGLVRSKGFVEDLDVTLARSTMGARLLGQAWVPTLSGLRHIGTVGGEFLPRMARWVLSIAERFDAWAEAARRSGRMSQWIERGAEVAGQFWRILKNLGGAVRELFRAGGDSGSTLDSIERVTANMRDWLASAEGQGKVRGFFAGLRSVLASVAEVGPRLADALLAVGPALQQVAEQGSIADTLNVGAVVMGFLADNIDTVATLLPFLAAGFVVAKTAQLASNAAVALSLPLRIFEAVLTRRQIVASRALTAALASNTVVQRGAAGAALASAAATSATTTASRRSVVAMVAQKVAMVAARAGTIAWTAVNWLLAASQWAALGPILLVIVAIALLAAGVVIAYQKSETFRKIVQAAFRAVLAAARAVASFWTETLWPGIKGVFSAWQTAQGKVFDFLLDLPGKIKKGFGKLGETIFAPFKWAFNRIADGWNNTFGSLRFTIPGWVPGIGGNSIDVPDIPRLARGAVVGHRRGGTLAVVGEGSEDEAVAPLSTLGAMIRQAIADGFRGRAGGGDTHVHVNAMSPFSLPQVMSSMRFSGAS